MSCPAILTGTHFLASTLGHIDCQARGIGAYGYGALADPNSGAARALATLLAVFIAVFGLRLLLGERLGLKDGVLAILKLGLVLTLALSWPAWRVLAYDLTFDAPGELSASVGRASALPGSNRDRVGRLQNVDDGIVAMTMFGTGRLTGGVVGDSDLGDSPRGIALADQTGLGWGRVLWLTGAIAPEAVVRLGAGILLALAPLLASAMLFAGTMGLFIGWLRGLVFSLLGAMTLGLIQGVQLAIFEPWISDVLAKRDGGSFTPSAPTELIVLALAFLLINFGALGLIGRVAFMKSAALWPAASALEREHQFDRTPHHGKQGSAPPPTLVTRAEVIADAVALTLRREGTAPARTLLLNRAAYEGPNQSSATGKAPDLTQPDLLGTSFRRTRPRRSAAGARRDSPS